jgi:GNAT superfamily N-acetyltransferase
MSVVCRAAASSAIESASVSQKLKIRVEPACERDLPIILRFTRALAEYEKMLDKVTATEADLGRSLFGPRPFAEAALAYADDEAVGLAVYYHTYSTFSGKPNLYLEDIIVDERRRGQGVGKALLAYVARLAVERKCGRLEWSVLDWNEPAIGFYRAHGAEAVDTWKLYHLSGQPLRSLAAEA